MAEIRPNGWGAVGRWERDRTADGPPWSERGPDGRWEADRGWPGWWGDGQRWSGLSGSDREPNGWSEDGRQWSGRWAGGPGAAGRWGDAGPRWIPGREPAAAVPPKRAVSPEKKDGPCSIPARCRRNGWARISLVGRTGRALTGETARSVPGPAQGVRGGWFGRNRAFPRHGQDCETPEWISPVAPWDGEDGPPKSQAGPPSGHDWRSAVASARHRDHRRGVPASPGDDPCSGRPRAEGDGVTLRPWASLECTESRSWSSPSTGGRPRWSRQILRKDFGHGGRISAKMYAKR